jgi:SM-20-related protein
VSNLNPAQAAALVEPSIADIAIHDDLLDLPMQQAVLGFLRGPGWSHGAFSDPSPDASRYWYKHFAGYAKSGQETHAPDQIEAELAATAPLVAEVWRRLRAGILSGHALTRCYANGYPFGSEGGVHLDSNIVSHFTAIYYPHQEWRPNFAGETVFFNADQSDIIASVYPKPNRLVVFPGVIPHVARGVSRTCPEMRITLMFKTAS